MYQEKMILDRVDRELLEMDFIEVELPVGCWINKINRW